MTPEEFDNYMQAKKDESSDYYGICPPPLDAQDGLNILINHFLGEDWYVSHPLSQSQVNTEAVYQILLQNQPKKIKSIFNIIKTGGK